MAYRKLILTIKKGVWVLAYNMLPRTQQNPDIFEMQKYLTAGANAPVAATPLSQIRFVVLDTETTGFAPHRSDEIIEIGAVTIQNNKLTGEKFHRLVNPNRSIPSRVTALTGISAEQLSEAADPCSALKHFLAFLDNSFLVGHHIGFDLAFLDCKLKQLCGDTIGNQSLDTSIIARALCPNLSSYSLDALLPLHAIKPTGRHTALGDALLTAQLFKMQIETLESMQITTIGELGAFLFSAGKLSIPNH